jgi:hypothetical protein
MMQQLLHHFKAKGFEATQSLHRLKIKGFKATQSLHRPKSKGFKASQLLHRFKKKGFQVTKSLHCFKKMGFNAPQSLHCIKIIVKEQKNRKIDLFLKALQRQNRFIGTFQRAPMQCRCRSNRFFFSGSRPPLPIT